MIENFYLWLWRKLIYSYLFLKLFAFGAGHSIDWEVFFSFQCSWKSCYRVGIISQEWAIYTHNPFGPGVLLVERFLSYKFNYFNRYIIIHVISSFLGDHWEFVSFKEIHQFHLHCRFHWHEVIYVIHILMFICYPCNIYRVYSYYPFMYLDIGNSFHCLFYTSMARVLLILLIFLKHLTFNFIDLFYCFSDFYLIIFTVNLLLLFFCLYWT